MKITILLTFLSFFLLDLACLHAQTQTIVVTVTNGQLIRCATSNIVDILITPNPTLSWTTIQLDWGDGSPLVTINPGQPLTLSHTYPPNALTGCVYNCSSALYNGVCYTIGVQGFYVAPALPDNNSIVLTFKRAPTADFTVTSPVCVGDPACVTPTFCPSNDNSSTFTWTLGNGNTLYGNTPPCFSYATGGTYPITVTHNNFCGTATHTENIVVKNPPTANATPNPIVICNQDTAFLIGTTSQNTNIYLWAISPGMPNVDWKYVLPTNSASSNPIIKFMVPGFYTATLTASNPPCPMSQDNISIQVDAPINLSINPQQNACTSIVGYSPSVNINGNANATLSYSQYIGGTFVAFVPPITLSASLTPKIIKVTAMNACGTVSKSDTFFVKPIPTAVASATTPTSICAQGIVSFSGNASTNALSYSWAVSPGSNGVNWQYVSGTSIGSMNPQIQFLTVNTYTVTLYVNNAPCPIVSANPITVNVISAPLLSLTAQPDMCAPFNYTPSPATPGAVYTVTLAPNTNIPFPYNNLIAGTYFVSASLTNLCGNQLKKDTFVVHAPVTACIQYAGNDTVCLGASATFNGSCSQNAISYLWNNGTTNSSATYTFSTLGNAVITLTADNPGCLADVETMNIFVLNAPVLSLTTQSDMCAGFNYSPSPATIGAVYTVTRAPNTNVAFPYNNLIAGTYFVNASLSNLCGNQVKKDTFVVHAPVTACIQYAGNDTVCLGASATFNGICSQNETSYLWNNGTTNSSLTYTFSTLGNTVITLTADNPGCSPDVETMNIFVLNAPSLSLSPQIDACAGFNYSPSPATIGAVYVVTRAPNNTNVPFPYNNLIAGTYYVNASLTNLCGNQLKKDTFTVYNPVTACIQYAGNDTVCFGTSATFNGICSQNETSYLWNNGTTNSSATYTFSTLGNNAISLTADNPGCPAEVETINIFVLNAPSLSLNPQIDACAGFNYTPSPATIGAVYVVTRAPNNTNVPFPYNNLIAGTYFVSASLTNLCGNQLNKDTFTVYNPVTACIQYAGNDTVCLGTSATFNGICSQNETSYLWNNNTMNSSLIYTFSTLGNNVISLTADNPGCPADVETLNILVENAPILNFLPQADACLQLSYSPQPQYYPLATYTINGNPVNIFPYNMLQAGSPYYIKASISNTCSSYTYRDTIVIFGPVPVTIVHPAVSDTLVCQNASINLLAQPNDGAGNWWLNGSMIPANYTFPNTGFYEIIYIRGAGNCETRDTVHIQVQEITVLVQDTAVCQNANGFSLPVTANPTGGNGYWYATSCPNCVTNNGFLQIPNFPANLTTLPITYVYQSPQGCKDSAILTVTNIPIHADFTFLDDTPCTFEVIEVNTNAAVFATAQWEIDGIASPLPPFAPLTAGIHSIEMFAIVGSCIDSFTKTVVVTPIPSPAIFAPSTDSGCPPLQVNLTRNDTAQATVTYSWDFGRGLNDIFVGFLPQNTLIYPNLTDSIVTYFIVVSAENFCGTTLSDTAIHVFPLPFANIGIDSTDIRCSPFHATFTNRSTGLPTQAIWDFGDGTPPLTTMDSVVFHTYFAPDTILHLVIRLISINHCGQDTAYQTITVVPPYINSFFTIDNYIVCPGTPVHFQDASTPAATTIFWDFGDGNTSSDLNPTHIYTVEDTTFAVTMYSTNQCGYDSIKHIIKILTSPKPAFTFPILNCQNQLTAFENLTNGNYTFVWDFGDGTSDSTHTSPEHIYTGDSTYQVTLSATDYPNECVGKIIKPLTIRAQPIADFEVSSAKNCYPAEQVLFTNISEFANTYTWYFGDGTTWQNAANANTGHAYTGVGEFNVTLIATYNNVCIDSITQYHAVTMDFCEYYIANAFTPNGDGHNDLFVPIGFNVAEIAYLQIFDRWGRMVYEAKKIPANGATGWDGTFNNQPAPEGVYVYKVQMTYIDGSPSEPRVGDVSLVR